MNKQQTKELTEILTRFCDDNNIKNIKITFQNYGGKTLIADYK